MYSLTNASSSTLTTARNSRKFLTCLAASLLTVGRSFVDSSSDDCTRYTQAIFGADDYRRQAQYKYNLPDRDVHFTQLAQQVTTEMDRLFASQYRRIGEWFCCCDVPASACCARLTVCLRPVTVPSSHPDHQVQRHQARDCGLRSTGPGARRGRPEDGEGSPARAGHSPKSAG